MSIAELNTLYAAYEAALKDADYDMAIVKLMAIQGRLATTPNLRKDLGKGGSREISWNPAAIPGLIAQCQQLKAGKQMTASGPFSQTKVRYTRPSRGGGYA